MMMVMMISPFPNGKLSRTTNASQNKLVGKKAMCQLVELEVDSKWKIK
jgi:hypothetical protein